MATITPESLKHMRQSAQERKLCWLVGCFLRSEQPQLFETLLDSAMAKPNAALASLIYAASYVKSRGRPKVGKQLPNSVDTSVGDNALERLRRGKNK